MKRFLVLATLVSSVASAQTYDYAKKIGIGAGYGRDFPLLETGAAGDGHGDKSGDAYNLHARYGLTSASGLIFEVARVDLAHLKVNETSYNFMYLYRFNALSRFTPTIGAAVGILDYSKISSKEDWIRTTAKIRGGAEYSFTQNLMGSFDVDLKYINNAFGDGAQGNSHEQISIVPQVNLTWFFGCGEACEKKEAPKTAPVAAAKPAAKVDGDMDKDGVLDSKDKCPGTAAGAKVNAYGCVAEEKAHIEVEVLFASSSATLSAASHAKIDELAAFLNEHKNTKAEIQGHTDSSGNPVKNKLLSQQRADAVKNYLVNSAKIAASRLHSTGYGAEKPVADNKTVEGRAENRRVMAVIEE